MTHSVKHIILVLRGYFPYVLTDLTDMSLTYFRAVAIRFGVVGLLVRGAQEKFLDY